MMNTILENQRLSRWATLLTRKPGQYGAIHESDAELVPLGDGRLLALTVDQVAEEIALGLYREPETVGRIAVVASLSDLAAVGAEVTGLLISVTLPTIDTERVQDAVASGIREAAERAQTYVLGGDTSAGSQLSIACTAVGTVPQTSVHTRIGAAPGDTVYATGKLGLGAALAAVQLLSLPKELLSEAEFRPELRLREGQALRGLASSCIDTSDGLISTLDQLSRLNGVAIAVDEDPAALLHPKAEQVRAALRVGPVPVLAAIHGEFELVFTVPEHQQPKFRDVWQSLGFTAIRLGTVAKGSGVSVAGRELDTAWIRNLTYTTGNDAREYFRHIVALCE